MGVIMKLLSRAEELVLLSVGCLGDEAYGVTIRKHVIDTTGEDWSVGAIYVPLERLAKWGYLETDMSDPTPERGGRRKRFYRLTPTGLAALRHTREVHEELWSRMPAPDSRPGGDS
jgi:DNA-binding PadR family transcriptional regulator